jgi:hypothetical protein
MFKNKPKMAKRWAKEQEKSQGKGSFKKLPKKVKSRDDLETQGWDELSDESFINMENIK